MVKAIILVINNTPNKTYRIAQCTDSWNQLHSLHPRRCVFLTAVPIIKLFAWGEGDIGGHSLPETTSRGLCGQVCPSRTSERGGEGDCEKEGGGGEGERERERAQEGGVNGAGTLRPPQKLNTGAFWKAIYGHEKTHFRFTIPVRVRPICGRFVNLPHRRALLRPGQLRGPAAAVKDSCARQWARARERESERERERERERRGSARNSWPL
jgi:hypothetical protein